MLTHNNSLNSSDLPKSRKPTINNSPKVDRKSKTKSNKLNSSVKFDIPKTPSLPRSIRIVSKLQTKLSTQSFTQRETGEIKSEMKVDNTNNVINKADLHLYSQTSCSRYFQERHLKTVEKLALIIKEKKQKEEKSNTFIPKVNKRRAASSNYGVFSRLSNANYRKSDAGKNLFPELTFKPEITKMAKRMNRSIDDLFEWQYLVFQENERKKQLKALEEVSIVKKSKLSVHQIDPTRLYNKAKLFLLNKNK